MFMTICMIDNYLAYLRWVHFLGILTILPFLLIGEDVRFLVFTNKWKKQFYRDFRCCGELSRRGTVKPSGFASLEWIDGQDYFTFV